ICFSYFNLIGRSTSGKVSCKYFPSKAVRKLAPKFSGIKRLRRYKPGTITLYKICRY
ncbi:hypothetical protein K432DRAFT_312918, partial [Lepidopterella palustris CBS 459.81]